MAFLCSALTAGAQIKEFDKLGKEENVDVVNAGPEVIEMLRAQNNPQIAPVLPEKIENLQIYSTKSSGNSEKDAFQQAMFLEKSDQIISKLGYPRLMTVETADRDMKVYGKENRSQAVIVMSGRYKERCQTIVYSGFFTIAELLKAIKADAKANKPQTVLEFLEQQYDANLDTYRMYRTYNGSKVAVYRRHDGEPLSALSETEITNAALLQDLPEDVHPVDVFTIGGLPVLWYIHTEKDQSGIGLEEEYLTPWVLTTARVTEIKVYEEEFTLKQLQSKFTGIGLEKRHRGWYWGENALGSFYFKDGQKYRLVELTLRKWRI